jgi:hypothetical protein
LMWFRARMALTRRVVHDNALAAPRLGWDRKAEQRGRSGRGDHARVRG